MDTTYLVIIITTVIILFTVVLAIVLLATVRKISKGNRVIKLEVSEIEWKCPNCQKVMDSGLSLAGRGIIWREKTEKTPGLFSNIGSVLENTISLNVLPALNVSWRCSSCKLVILDNSKMVKIINS